MLPQVPHVSDRQKQGKATPYLDAYPESDAIHFAQNANELTAPTGIDERVAEAHVQSSETARPQYVYSRPMTVGGAPATLPWKLYSPFDSPCEVCIISVAFAGPTLFCKISDSDSGFLPADNATLQDQSWSIMVVSNVLTTIPLGGDNWYPLAQGTAVSVYVGGNGSGTKSVWVNVQFRRRVSPAGVPYLGG